MLAAAPLAGDVGGLSVRRRKKTHNTCMMGALQTDSLFEKHAALTCREERGEWEKASSLT